MKFSFKKYALKKKSTSYIYHLRTAHNFLDIFAYSALPLSHQLLPHIGPTETPLPTPIFNSLNPVNAGHIFIGVGSPTATCSTYLACLPEGSRLSLSSSSSAGTFALWPPSPVSLRFWVCFWRPTEEVGGDFIFTGSSVQCLGYVPLLGTHFLEHLSPLCCERSTASFENSSMVQNNFFKVISSGFCLNEDS